MCHETARTKQLFRQISLRTIFLVVFLSALIVGWLVDHSRMQQRVELQQQEVKRIGQRLDAFVDWFAANYESDKHPPAVQQLIKEARR